MRAAAISGPHPPPQGREAAQDRGLRSESAGLLQSGVHAPPGLTLGGSGPCQLLRSVMAAECPAETRSSPDRWGVQEQANERWRAQQDVCTGLGRKLGPGDGGSQEGRDEPAPPPVPWTLSPSLQPTQSLSPGPVLKTPHTPPAEPLLGLLARTSSPPEIKRNHHSRFCRHFPSEYKSSLSFSAPNYKS